MSRASAVAESVAETHASFDLSPMQAGMLFQSLLHPPGPETGGYDIEQLHLSLEHGVELESFQEAWNLVARRHPALTAAFEWEGVVRPQQRSSSDVVVPIEVLDWKGLTPAQRESQRRSFLEQDRSRGFDLRRPPLMRVTLLRTGEASAEAVWTFHHILIDGRSIPAVLKEVFEAYGALCKGERPSLPPPTRPFRDYISWLADRDSTRSHGFFKELLKGKRTPTPLPLAEPAGRPLPGHGKGTLRRLVDPQVRAAAHALAGRSCTTVATVIQAAWALVLSRLTSEEDVVFGVTRSCRRSALEGAVENTVGIFINTVPARARLGDEVTVSELLTEVRKQSVALRDHEHLPLVEIQAQSELPPGATLFESLLMFDNREINRVLRHSDAQWRSRTCTLHEQPSPPLVVTVFDDEVLELRFLYDQRRYREPTVERMAAYLEQAISGLAEKSDRPLGEVDILPPAERHRVLFDWNETTRPFPDDLCIHELFERRVELQPEAIAVEQDGVTLTYRALESRANQLAQALLARGARPGMFVGICLRRTPDLVVSLLAVAKTGAAYVPLDPDYPVDRLAFMMEDAKALLVLTEERHRPLFSCDTLVLDGEHAAQVASMPATRPARTAKATDVCYVIYTSGSTGKPKGVVLTHRAVVNTFDWVSRTFEVGPGDRLLFVTSPCFDLSVYDTFGALGAGATVVVASSEQLKDPQLLATTIVDARITIWDSAPAALQRLVTFFPSPERVAPLRMVMLSGDWIPLSLPGAVKTAFPSAQVRSLGGATEAAIWSNWFPVGELDARWTSVPYGKPIQNSHYHVLDRRLQPVPIGVAGDLYIGGACLASGYLNRKELTEERFIPDPFTGEASDKANRARLYKTGDLARYFDDGNLEFLGRSDFQVKIRGFRVELGEVEAVLAAFPEVRETLCTAHLDASGQKSLVAYVVLRGGAKLDEETLKARVGSKVPDYMVPSYVVFLDAMPLSVNGKVDRQALPSPTARASRAESVPPRTERERQMCTLWQELLQRPQIGVTDNFFALGGHSLLAVMLVARVKQTLGLELPLASVLEHPTVEGLVASLNAETTQVPGGRQLVTLNRAATGERPPLVLMSGIGGFGFVFQGLATQLGSAQPVHVLHAIGAQDAREGFDHTIEEMAAIYEPQILAACPQGPIVVGGYSFGSLVAFELAHRLRERGREVPLIISFDGFAPGYPERMPLGGRIISHLSAFFGQGSSARRTYVRERVQRMKERLYNALGRPEEALPSTPNADPETDLRLRRVSAGLWRARDRYLPTFVDSGDLLLVKTTVAEPWIAHRFDDPLYGWRGWVRGNIEVVSVPGKHLTLFDEGNLRPIADAIDNAVARFTTSRSR